MQPLLTLPAIDGVEITTIMDNSFDAIMSSTSVAHRFPLQQDAFTREQLRAEHGTAFLITVINQGRRETILFDTGVTPNGALHNIGVLGIDLRMVQAIVLSHGHTDHTQGLDGFHLSGAMFEPIIPQTVEALQQINPAVIVPAHCTGWRATHHIAQAMPEAFVPNSVGTTFVLTAE